MSHIWRVRLSEQAEQDVIDVSRWTSRHFGPQQADKYVETILMAIDDLRHDPRPMDAKDREEMGRGVQTLHVTRQGLKGRHFIVYRVADVFTLDVLRLLHDSIDLAKNLPSEAESSH